MRDPQDAKFIRCSLCWGEIYEGEEYGERGGKVICDECVETEWMRKSLSDKLTALGYRDCEVTF